MQGTIHSILARFPEREFEVHRRFRQDPRFRSVCADYEEAAAALRHWQAVQLQHRVAEYRSFLGELEAEILAHLAHPPSDDPLQSA